MPPSLVLGGFSVVSTSPSSFRTDSGSGVDLLHPLWYPLVEVDPSRFRVSSFTGVYFPVRYTLVNLNSKRSVITRTKVSCTPFTL